MSFFHNAPVFIRIQIGGRDLNHIQTLLVRLEKLGSEHFKRHPRQAGEISSNAKTALLLLDRVTSLGGQFSVDIAVFRTMLDTFTHLDILLGEYEKTNDDELVLEIREIHAKLRALLIDFRTRLHQNLLDFERLVAKYPLFIDGSKPSN